MFRKMPRYDIDYINSRLNKSGGSSACWPWTGLVSKVHGIGVACIDNEHYWAPRYVFGALRHTPPRNLKVFHSCGNRLCCNPAHMELHKEGWVSEVARKKKYLLRPKDVTYMSYLWCEGEMNRLELAEKFGVKPCTISSALNRSTHRDVPRCCKKRPYFFHKLNSEIVREIRRKRALGHPLKILSEEYGVSESHISRISRRLVLQRVPDE